MATRCSGPRSARLAASYAINEMGDWLGLVALSVLVFELTGSALATTLLFLGTGFLPALLAPLLVARLERPPPRFVLPSIYAAEAAAFLGLALLADHFSLAAVVALAAIDGALALTAKTLTRAVDRADARARAASCGPATRSSTSPSPPAPRSARSWPAASSPALGVQIGADPRRRLLLRDRLDRVHRRGPCRRPSPSRASCASSSAPALGYIREHTHAATA